MFVSSVAAKSKKIIKKKKKKGEVGKLKLIVCIKRFATTQITHPAS